MLRPPDLSTAIFSGLANALASEWVLAARPDQLPPPDDDWSIWLMLGGRGAGKTRAGAEWVRSAVAAGFSRIALVAPTAADARDVMVEGESGILAISPNHDRPSYQSTLRRLEWPNGATATTYSADEPDRLRGPQHEAAWGDEIGTWRDPDAYHNLMLGLRLGKRPRAVLTTTPKPTKLIRGLVARDGDDVRVTRAGTRANAKNLAPSFLSTIMSRYEGTRLGRQEIDGELLTDTPGALWTAETIDKARIDKAPALQRIVVAIDPAVTSREGSDETGIIVAGKDAEEHGYILADLSGRYSPPEWARAALAAMATFKADRIVAEVNQGGEMVGATLRHLDPNVPFRSIHASRGKVIRAEPIAALYEQGRIHHVGAFPQLEDQMCAFASDFDRNRAGYSPDRLDAAVWALTELFPTTQIAPVAQTGRYTYA